MLPDPSHLAPTNLKFTDQLKALKDPKVLKYCQYYSIVFGGYVGLSVHAAARICFAAHGGQIIMSSAVQAAIPEPLPDGVWRVLFLERGRPRPPAHPTEQHVRDALGVSRA